MIKKKIASFVFLLLMIFMICGCESTKTTNSTSTANEGTTSLVITEESTIISTTLSDVTLSETEEINTTQTTEYITENTTTTTQTVITTGDSSGYDENLPTTIILSDSNITVENNNGYVSINNGVVTILLSGTYEVSGSISEGSLVVDIVDDDEVDLLLIDLIISSSETAPINVINADKVEISIEGTVVLTDNRSSDIEETEETPNAALYSAADMDIDGSGTLYVYGYYNNGIGTNDDLEMEELEVHVVALNNALKGSDSLTIVSGTYDLTAQTGDGLKTSNSNVSDKGNQRGVITILGGAITINAGSDGIDAAYDVIIENNPEITIYTSETYATGVGASASVNTNDTLYLRISSSISTNYRYSVYFTNASASTGEWVDAEFLSTGYVSGRLYYFYTIDLPSEYDYYTLYQFSSTASNSLTSYVAKSETASLNTYFDMLVVGSRSIVGTMISVTWSMYGTSSTDSSNYSTKGIKADNSITINGGSIVIYSYDDAIHSNNDNLLENGSYGEGNVNINGGTLTLTSKDDGIHGDQYVNITSGTIIVLTSYEGIEGNIINIYGGTINVIATDDGLNAKYDSLYPAINVSGGSVFISVGTGDTDAIDSNGSYTQTGGFVVSRSALSGGMGGAMDVDGSVSVTGGTFVGIGYSESIAYSSGDNYSTGRMSVTISAGTYTVEDSTGNVIMTFTTSTYTYVQIWISSDLFESGTQYTLLRNGTSIRTWTAS